MKTLFLSLLLSISASIFSQNSMLTGSWTGDDAGEPITMLFDQEGYCTIYTGNESIGGPNMDLAGESAYMVYVVVAAQPFHHVDINLYQTEGNTLLASMLGIFELDGNTLHICMDFEGEAYPEEFIEGDSLWLTKE